MQQTRGDSSFSRAADQTVVFLDKVKSVLDLVRDLDDFGDLISDGSTEENFYLDLGNYSISEVDVKNNIPKDHQLVLDDKYGQSLKSKSEIEKQQDEELKDSPVKSGMFRIMKKLEELGFSIPIVNEPTNIVKLLLGKTDVDLFRWDLPLDPVNAEVTQNFPIYPPLRLEGLLSGAFGADAKLGFGFDISGLSEWERSGFATEDAWKVFNGFYIADTHKNDNLSLIHI